ncbi:unnamed protein product [Notodromas monacha]|uniref:Probable hydroxyacid-oxoacid transhydrogenase, mitochondrial n=1 Tax=Notodromas monacha TaxID=399045 RepID=A0A7R9GDY2_9CRUS|nr:unnamed protein product [Notodromas monacha]CAG0917448.1 unnamed protein product [Notodromas monacha]
MRIIGTRFPNRVRSLLEQISDASCRCPSHAGGTTSRTLPTAAKHLDEGHQASSDYAFEMACSNIRYGMGVTREIGMDLKNMGSRKASVFVDPYILEMQLPPVKAVLDSLHAHNCNYEIFSNIRVEPTDSSFQDAIDYVRARDFDAFVAVGGGSTMDTCKAANLFAADKSANLLKYTNAPIGRGEPVRHTLAPLIAVPTTAGTGSETTGTAIFDYTPLHAKTGISNRSIRPTLGVVDPLHLRSLPERVAAYSGFDVLCHALESFTAIPFHERKPRPDNPINRPAYQGSNPISDIWARETLRIIRKYFVRSVRDPEDMEARSRMHLASAFAGIGFGNAGVHLCHGMSYPISGCVKDYKAADYKSPHPLIPHGLSVVMTAPAVFQFTAPACPARHLEAAALLGADITSAKEEHSGTVLADIVRWYMLELKIDNGLAALGFTTADIPQLVEGTLPQHRVTKLSPRPQAVEDLATILENSMTVY